MAEQVQRVSNPTFNANNVMRDQSPVKHQYILWHQVIHDFQLPQYQLPIRIVAPWAYFGRLEGWLHWRQVDRKDCQEFGTGRRGYCHEYRRFDGAVRCCEVLYMCVKSLRSY